MKKFRRYRYIPAFLTIALISFAGWRLSTKGFAHSVAGLPHLATSCDTNSHPILVIGQSQASNTGPVRAISGIRSFALNDGICYHLRDPMPGTGGRGGSVWPRFADALQQPVTIIDIAISGSAIERWTTPEQVQKVHRALADFKALGFAEPTIIWMQGETNAARNDTKEHYEKQLKTVLDIAPRHNWIIARESICNAVTVRSASLNEARDSIARTFPHVTIGPDLDDIPLGLRQPDHCHMTPENQKVIAQQLADIFKTLKKPILPSSPSGFSRLGL